MIAPLDWGLGHASRCIPIIRELLVHGDEVIIAAEKNLAAMLEKEFPDLKIIFLRGYRAKYSSFLPMFLSMAFQTPKFAWRIFREHEQLKKIILDYRIDAVISDNRYGLWNKKIQTVFITHQVMIKCPSGLKFLEPLLYRINKFFIKKFDECWIPDDEKKLSGDLSYKYPFPSNAKFIGTLSRWKGKKNNFSEKKYDVIGIVSGPEPHRSAFEKILIKQLSDSTLKCLIVLGKPEEQSETTVHGNLSIVSHLDSKKLLEAISSSESVICRAGYSSIMDLEAIGKNAVLVPTPGQTEQIYLATYLRKEKKFFSVSQKSFYLRDAIRETGNYSVANTREVENYLPILISTWRKKINGY